MTPTPAQAAREYADTLHALMEAIETGSIPAEEADERTRQLTEMAFAQAYAAGAAAHIEHHQCARCYAAGVAAAIDRAEKMADQSPKGIGHTPTWQQGWYDGLRHLAAALREPPREQN